jgi:hypothetical protein
MPAAKALFFHVAMRLANGSLSQMPPFRRFLHLRSPRDFNKCFTNGLS